MELTLALVGLVGCSAEVTPAEPSATVTPAPTATTPPAPTATTPPAPTGTTPPVPKPQDEAIQNVKEIAAAAKAHFDKTGKLCGSASPVPAALASVAGQRYTPSAVDGADFNTGDEEYGWKCLGWKPSQPTIGYMLDYRAGGPYVTEGMVGALDPGPTGFEASAQGDLDADGVPSTFALGGGVVSSSGELEVSSNVYVNQENE